MAHRTDIKDQLMERPSEDEVMSTAERTKAALEKLVSGKIKAVNPSTVPKSKGEVSFVRYTPDQGDGTKQRIIKMVEVVEDPLEPVKFKGKKIPRGPPSPPPPILRSPPRKVTAQDQKDWMIPPCVSNWKNNKGYTIPLDKRLAADGRGLQDVLINDRFAQFSEALYVADRHAREEVRQRSLMQQKIAQKEKEAKEENLRLLAQRAREERSGIVAPAARMVAAGGGGGAMPAALAGYGSDSDSEADSASEAGGVGAGGDGEEEEEDEEAARLRDVARKERNKERERDMRMSNMGTEQRAKVLARATGRDISEKIALGLAKPTMSKDSMLDSRLFNQESLSGSFADEDSYNLYDKPLFSGSSAAAAIYKPRGANVDDEGNEVAAEEGINRSMQNDRFGLGVAGKHGFEGSNTTEVRDGSVDCLPSDVPVRLLLTVVCCLLQACGVRAGCADRGRSFRTGCFLRDSQRGGQAWAGYVQQGRPRSQACEGLILVSSVCLNLLVHDCIAVRNVERLFLAACERREEGHTTARSRAEGLHAWQASCGSLTSRRDSCSVPFIMVYE